MLSRRSFFVKVPTIVLNYKEPKPKAVSQETQRPGTVYVYETDRFRSMYTVLDHEKSFTVRQRVDWYDPVTDKPMSVNNSMVYITDVEKETNVY